MLTQKLTKEFLDDINERQVVASAADTAATAARQIVADRSYYTKNVVGKLEKEWPGFKGADDYHSIEGAIPLPATFLREVSQSLDETAGYRYDLLSKWNIAKDKGLRDEFEHEAWERLSTDAAVPYERVVASEDGAELRHAFADVAVTAGCVSCHNTHPASPKNDFQLNDLMGILVVSVPITRDATLAPELLSREDDAGSGSSDKTAQLFATTLAALRDGGRTYQDLAMTDPVTVPATEDPEIVAKLAVVDEQWKRLQKTVAALWGREVDFGAPEFVQPMRELREITMVCLKEMNTAVGMWQANTESRTALMSNIQLASQQSARMRRPASSMACPKWRSNSAPPTTSSH